VDLLKIVAVVIVALVLLSIVFSIIGWLASAVTFVVEIVLVAGLGYLVWHIASHRKS
jgi:hypothetical protein